MKVEELIKYARACAKAQAGACSKCPYFHDGECMEMLLKDLANMLEKYSTLPHKTCATCKHCVQCKRFVPEKEDPWEWYYICDKFAHEENGWALELEDADCRCEEWISK